MHTHKHTFSITTRNLIKCNVSDGQSLGWVAGKHFNLHKISIQDNTTQIVLGKIEKYKKKKAAKKKYKKKI